jgi:hypothetical protein
MDAGAAGITHCVISVEVRDRYSPDERGDCDIGVKGTVLHEGELDGDDGIEVDRGEEDMGGLGECGLCGGGVSGMGTSGLTLPVTVGEIRGATRSESRDTTLLPPTDWSLN